MTTDVDTVWIGGAEQPVPKRARVAVAPIIASHGLSLVGVELAREGHRNVLWVYIDSDDGVTIDDCVRVSPEVSAALDVDDPLPDAYDLRVSSPGLDRPLMTSSDFARFAGRDVKIQLATPLGGRKRFTGRILGCTDGQVELACSDGEHRVPVTSIQRARLQYALTIGKKKP